jgi:hypothetical protein
MNNTKLKELGLYIQPRTDIVELRRKKRELHRLFNPRKPRREESNYTNLKRLSLEKLLKYLNDNDIPIKYVELPHRIHPKLVPQPKKISICDQNRNILYSLGYIPKKTKSSKHITISHSNKVRIDEVWSVEEHGWIRPRPIQVKKDKQISPYWVKKLTEWEVKQ